MEWRIEEDGYELSTYCPDSDFSLIEVHDYRTGKGILPANAWFVEGSRVIVCEHGMANMGEHKNMPDMVFDRCSPGTLAFASKPEADAFVAQNGGAVLSFNQLMSEARYQ